MNHRTLHLRKHSIVAISLIGTLAGCSDDGETLVEDAATEPSSSDPSAEKSDASLAAPSGHACEMGERVGSFSLELTDEYTSFRGAVSDSVSPLSVFEIVREQGGCRVLTARSLFCSTPCAAGVEICAGDDECVPASTKLSAGEVELSGLEVGVEVSPNGITQDYNETISEPLPAFLPGAEISLRASGEEIESFVLAGRGMSPLLSEMMEIEVASGAETVLSWEPPSGDLEFSEVHVSLSVNAHGTTSGWLECSVPDVGAFTIPEVLITELVELGLSGFPRVTLSRRSVDSAEIAEGCVDFSVASSRTLPVVVPGLASCSDDSDCAEGLFCLPELVCGE